MVEPFSVSTRALIATTTHLKHTTKEIGTKLRSSSKRWRMRCERTNYVPSVSSAMHSLWTWRTYASFIRLHLCIFDDAELVSCEIKTFVPIPVSSRWTSIRAHSDPGKKLYGIPIPQTKTRPDLVQSRVFQVDSTFLSYPPISSNNTSEKYA